MKHKILKLFCLFSSILPLFGCGNQNKKVAFDEEKNGFVKISTTTICGSTSYFCFADDLHTNQHTAPFESDDFDTYFFRPCFPNLLQDIHKFEVVPTDEVKEAMNCISTESKMLNCNIILVKNTIFVTEMAGGLLTGLVFYIYKDHHLNMMSDVVYDGDIVTGIKILK